jgi:hypothetical protein
VFYPEKLSKEVKNEAFGAINKGFSVGCCVLCSDMFGQWNLVGHPCVGGTEMDAAETFQSQGSFVLPLPGWPGRFIFMGDQWDPDNLAESRCTFCPHM